MPNTIKLLRSTTSGAAPASLVSGQVAINERDGVLYYRNSVGGVVTPFPGYIPDGYIYDCGIYAAIVPAAPTGLTATGGALQASLSWTAPTNTGGAALTDYFIEFSSNAGSSYSTWAHTASTATTATITGLAAGTYLFRVSAVNSVGTGASVTSSSTTVTASALLTMARSAASGSTSTASWTITGGTATPSYVRAAALQINASDGLTYYTWTAAGTATVTVSYQYSDDTGTSQSASINRTRSGSTTAQFTSTGNASSVAISVISGDTITITATGDQSQQFFTNVSVSAA